MSFEKELTLIANFTRKPNGLATLANQRPDLYNALQSYSSGQIKAKELKESELNIKYGK